MSYAVVWSEDGGPVHAGKLELTSRCVVLTGAAEAAKESHRKLLYDEVADIRVERPRSARLETRPALILECRTGTRLQIASVAGVAAGVRIAIALPEHALRRLFGALLLAVAFQLAYRARSQVSRYPPSS